MLSRIASAAKIIDAPVERVYQIIADYRHTHPLILPEKYFLSLEVEEGGFGEGTIVRFQMRLLGQTRSFRARVTEPEPGHILQETDLASGVQTWFRVSPADSQDCSEVTITTEFQAPDALQAFVARIMLEKVYRQELDLLDRLAEANIALAPSAAIETAALAEERR